MENVELWSEDGGDGMSEDMAKPDYEQICKEYEYKIEELNRQNDDLNRQNNDLQIRIQEMEYHNQRLVGRISGLEFAIRCNGVSGGEVTDGRD